MSGGGLRVHNPAKASNEFWKRYAPLKLEDETAAVLDVPSASVQPIMRGLRESGFPSTFLATEAPDEPEVVEPDQTAATPGQFAHYARECAAKRDAPAV